MALLSHTSRTPAIRVPDFHRRSSALRWLVCAALFGAILMSGIAGAQDGSLPKAASILQPQTYVSLQPVPRGRSFDIAIVAKITPGFHVNAHEPSEDYLIPTKVTAELPRGIVLVETTYPRGTMRTMRFSKTPLRVYDNSFTVKMRLRAENSAPLGHQKIALTIGYQACNQDACLPPTKIPATAELDLAAADARANPANANIFSPLPNLQFPSKH